MAGATLDVTTDGGVTWQPGFVRGATLKFGGGIAFADTQHGWLVSGGTIRATSDGGARWVVQLRHSAYRLQDVACHDADRAWVVGTLGDASPVVLATSDGGTRWVVQHVGMPGVDISQRGSAWPLSPAPTATTSGPRVTRAWWRSRQTAAAGLAAQAEPPDASTGLAIACADVSHVLMTTHGQPVMTSSNGGLSWSASGRTGWLPAGPAQGIAAILPGKF